MVRKKKADVAKNRLKELESECGEKAKLAEQYLNQLKYLQADFDNLQKRVDREKAQYIKYAGEGLIRDLLPIIDSIESAMTSGEKKEDAEGLSSIYTQFYDALEKHGLKKIDVIGKKLDTYYHEVLIREKSDMEEGVILEELQKGYTLNAKVIRHSKIKVSGGRKNG